MAQKQKTQPQKFQSTQRYLDIAEIKEDTVVLKDGTIRAVVLVSSINFALKSEDEQNALISAYMDFLNAFDFPFQIVIQSRKLDIAGYIQQLRDQSRTQPNELLKIQIQSYVKYIQELVELGEIMTKRFFVVIPYAPGGSKRKGFWERFQEVFTPGSVIRLRRKVFLDYKKELDLRVGHISGMLEGMGLKTVRLDTQSLIELYYNVYNPKTSARQPLADVTQLQVETETIA